MTPIFYASRASRLVALLVILAAIGLLVVVLRPWQPPHPPLVFHAGSDINGGAFALPQGYDYSYSMQLAPPCDTAEIRNPNYSFPLGLPPTEGGWASGIPPGRWTVTTLAPPY